MSHINTLKLHQLRLGELAPAEEGRLRAHLNGCDTCTARMRTQQALRQEFLKAPFPDALQPRAQGWRRWLIWLPAASLIPAALAVLFLLPTGEGGGRRGRWCSLQQDQQSFSAWTKLSNLTEAG